MRKLLLSFFLMVATITTASATETTFDLTKPEIFGFAVPGVSAGIDLANGSLAAGNVIITSKKVAQNDTRFWGTAAGVEGLRGYKSSTLTFTTTNGEVITGIAFAGGAITPAFLSFDSGSYTSPIWVGTANDVVLTFAGSAKISSIVVTTALASAVQAPRFSPVGGTYYTAQEVALSSNTEGATIYYTTNGEEPTITSTAYSAPIKLETTTTIKAMASKDGKISDIVSATYTIKEPIAIANIAEFNEQPKDVVVKFTNPATVIYQKGLYMFVQDTSGALQIYGSVGQVYQNGDIIPAGFVGVAGEYGGLVQLGSPISDTFKAGTAGIAIAPMLVTTQTVTNAMVNTLIKITDVTLTPVEGKNKNYTMTDENGNIAAYARFDGVAIPDDAKKYDVTAIVNSFNGTIQLFPTEIKEVVGTGVTEVENTIATIIGGNGTINIDVNENAQVLVINAIGQVIVRKVIFAGVTTVEIPAGFYVVKVNDIISKVVIK